MQAPLPNDANQNSTDLFPCRVPCSTVLFVKETPHRPSRVEFDNGAAIRAENLREFGFRRRLQCAKATSSVGRIGDKQDRQIFFSDNSKRVLAVVVQSSRFVEAGVFETWLCFVPSSDAGKLKVRGTTMLTVNACPGTCLRDV